MTRIFFSPHNDDETLFGAYTLMNHRPRVIVVLRSYVQELWNPCVFWTEREAETERAMDILGCEWTQWDHRDDAPNWAAITEDMAACDGPDIEAVYAPAVIEHGHPHHNWIGAIADEIFGKRCIHYCTYTGQGKQIGAVPVVPDKQMRYRKRDALYAYTSQRMHPYTKDHFYREQDEYYHS